MLRRPLEGSTRTVNLGGSIIGDVANISISPDSRHVALATEYAVDGVGSAYTRYLYIYDGFTGEQLARHAVSNDIPFFAPDGCDLWLVDNGGHGEVFRVEGGQVTRDPERRVDAEHIPEGYPWAPSHGYQVTKD